MNLYPLTFKPVFKERVWGGRNLERLYHKPLPPEVPIGESWEISDRPEEISVIGNGPLAGKDLHWLIENHSAELYGNKPPRSARFPLLIKILDAQDRLSLQVHPPADVAPKLGGEPKTEMWYITHAESNATLYLGLKKGATKEDFEKKLQAGTVAEDVHVIPVKARDAVFVPSGRVHAIDAGLMIFEIQQNSDTTYRVFDWNRVGLDGKPRQLHIPESLASINFTDVEPGTIKTSYARNPLLQPRPLVDDPAFRVDAFKAKDQGRFDFGTGELYILATLYGQLKVTHAGEDLLLDPGEFAMFPASLQGASFQAQGQTEFLRVRLGVNP